MVVATGAAYRRLGIPGLDALTGAGVFYGAATAEARAMSGEHVYVVGAANSAGQAALHLAGYARQVTMLVRGPSLEARMSDYLVKEIAGAANINVRLNTTLVDGHGAQRLEQLILRTPTGVETVRSGATTTDTAP